MSNTKDLISSLAEDASIEILPASVWQIDWSDPAWQQERRVYIGDLSNHRTGRDAGRQETIEAAGILLAHGMTPVPHIAARRIDSLTSLENIVTSMTRAGIADVLVVGGSVKTPRGPFESASSVMQTGLLDHFRSIAFAAHPRGNPAATQMETDDALAWKNEYARTHDPEVLLVTQLSFNAGPVLEWAARQRVKGNNLPVHVGITGPATLVEKFDYARKCGMGGAWNVVRSQLGNVSGFLQKIPAETIHDIAIKGGMRPPIMAPLTQGLHFYTFNNASRTVGFLDNLGRGAFRMTDKAFAMDHQPI